MGKSTVSRTGEEMTPQLGADGWGPLSHVEEGGAALGSGDSLSKSQQKRNQRTYSHPASSQAQLPGPTNTWGPYPGRRMMSALPLSGASGRQGHCSHIHKLALPAPSPCPTPLSQFLKVFRIPSSWFWDAGDSWLRMLQKCIRTQSWSRSPEG